MLVGFEESLSLLRCPRTRLPLVKGKNGILVALAEDPCERYEYRIVAGRPILIDFERSILDEEKTISSPLSSPVERRIYGFLPRFGRRLTSARQPATHTNMRRLIELLKGEQDQPRVLVIGGASVGTGMRPLYEDEYIHVHAFDIYASPSVQFLADAHALPLADSAFDGVVIQAVLEHVLQPADVVAEIRRVLRPNGLVYAETPFLQHVHEGAYDFTRFTDSGHRYLFRHFDLVSSGVLGGPGTQLMWSMEYFARALFRSRSVGKLVKLGLFWLRYLDGLAPERYAIDAASGLYFLGRKAD